ncbi:uncharacterized protein LOC108927348 [Scleropages formosus]|uniref:uncharacterized protein LOC108927348 n=1 Tax=Scleropages formosus TaxID=113540 RepID=UPI0010FAC5C2|nr:uncharacterized protein LOC108927348 [Scleropages formosus]
MGVVFQTGQAFGPSEETKVYSSVGGRAVLPCSGAKFSRSCAEVNWAKLWMSIVPEPVVCSGRVVTPSKRSSEPRLGADCSLHIDNLEKEDGGTYVCEHSAGNGTISLQLLSISVEPSTALAVSHRVSLHCYLSAFTGLVLCNHSGVKLTWVTERGTELQGDRYSISYKSACHTVLSVVLRATDHQRKWSCQLTEQQEVKTTVSHVTALTDAVEEMFASEGQTLMLPCTDPASLSAGEKLQWSLSETPLFSLTTDGQVTALVKGSTQGLRMNPDASLSIHGMTEKLSGRYCCSKLNNSDRISVHRMIVVHLLTLSRDSTDNTKANSSYSWTCSLTCVDSCEDLNLTWSVSLAGSQQDGAVDQINKTLVSKLILPEHHTPGKIACIALSDGTERGRQEWTFQSGNKMLTAAGLLLLALIVLISAIGVVLHVKRRQETCPGTVYDNIGMQAHIYEDCGEAVSRRAPLRSQTQSLETAQSQINTLYVLQSDVS